MRGDNGIGKPSGNPLNLPGNLMPKCLDAHHRVGRIKRGIEITGFLEDTQEHVEQLRTYGQPDDLRPVGLAGPRLLRDLGLRNAVTVEGLLHHDAA